MRLSTKHPPACAFTLLQLFFVVASWSVGAQAGICSALGVQDLGIGATFVVRGLLIVPAVLHTSLRSAASPSGRTAGRAVCLCCVVFCLPPRLWVTIYTLPQVHLRGRVCTSSLARVRHQVYDWHLDLRIPFSELRRLQSHWLLLLVFFFPPFTT